MNDLGAERRRHPFHRLKPWQFELLPVLALACGIAWFVALGAAPDYRTEAKDAIVLAFLVAVTAAATLLSWHLVGAHRAPPSFGQLIMCAMLTAILFVSIQIPLLAVLDLVLARDSAARDAVEWLAAMLEVGAVGFLMVAVLVGLAGATAYGLARWLLLLLIRHAAHR